MGKKKDCDSYLYIDIRDLVITKKVTSLSKSKVEGFTRATAREESWNLRGRKRKEEKSGRRRSVELARERKAKDLEFQREVKFS